MTFNVTLENGWFIFGDNSTFHEKTLFPLLRASIYDAEFNLFAPLLATGGLRVSAELHPWVIIRASYLEDSVCPGLEECIRQLMAARMDARKKRIAATGNAGIGTAGWISPMESWCVKGGNITVDHDADAD